MLAISSTIRKTQTQDGALLLDVERGQMYGLNPVGSTILELIATGCGEREIAVQLSAAYGAEIATVEHDVREFIETMSRHGIVHKSNAPREVSNNEP